MKLSTIVLVLVSVAGLSGAGAFVWRVRQRSVEWKKFIRYACLKDCLRKDEGDEFYDIARRSVPDEPAGARVLRIIVARQPGPDRRILILLEDDARSGEIRVHRFNELRDHLGTTVLPYGKVRGPSIWSGRGTLGEVLDGAFVLYTAKSLHHYYALDRDEPVLLTMVDKDGTVPPNNYVDPGFRVGPPIPADARSRCEALLSSSKPVEILQALTWLNGRHQDHQG
jgi:hypothetical protein